MFLDKKTVYLISPSKINKNFYKEFHNMHNSYRVGFLDLIRSNEESPKKKEDVNSSSLTSTQKRVSKSLVFCACLVFVRSYARNVGIPQHTHKNSYSILLVR